MGSLRSLAERNLYGLFQRGLVSEPRPNSSPMLYVTPFLFSSSSLRTSFWFRAHPLLRLLLPSSSPGFSSYFDDDADSPIPSAEEKGRATLRVEAVTAAQNVCRWSSVKRPELQCNCTKFSFAITIHIQRRYRNGVHHFHKGISVSTIPPAPNLPQSNIPVPPLLFPPSSKAQTPRLSATSASSPHPLSFALQFTTHLPSPRNRVSQAPHPCLCDL